MNIITLKYSNAASRQEPDNDDFDSFFEGSSNSEEIEELIPHREQNTPNKETEDIVKAEEEPKYYYPPPEPVPHFDSTLEKIMYYMTKYIP